MTPSAAVAATATTTSFINHPSSQQIETITNLDTNNHVDETTKINKSSSAHQMISSSSSIMDNNNLITNSNSSSNIPLLNNVNNQTVNSFNMINNNNNTNNTKIEPANMRIIETRIDANDIISQIELELTNRIANSTSTIKLLPK